MYQDKEQVARTEQNSEKTVRWKVELYTSSFILLTCPLFHFHA